jgi:glyoxylase-like metal-dependent hydrolase (beta-lactamase superfamily II)/rhodanese-related sulfurtransferase
LVVEMNAPTVLPLVDEGLGNSAYLVDLGDGRALVVDASRDLRSVRTTSEKQNLRVAFAADTHLHADFLSGARQLGVSDGARVLASAAGRRSFPHAGLDDGDEVDLGGLRLRALTTPGHTDEHVAFLLLDGEQPVGVFTGGSLLVGAAARTDLVAPDRTEELARAQYRSLRRLAELPDHVAVWPTHGAGSFCSAPPGADRTSSIGREKATNPLLAAADEDEFVRQLLGSLGSFPPYFLRLAAANRRGPDLLEEGTPRLPALTPGQALQAVRDGAWLIDVRPIIDFAAAHAQGALSIALRGAFATWLGWLVPPDTPLVVLRRQDQDPDEIVWQAAKIGYDLVGEVAGGFEAWTAAGLPTAATSLVGAGEAGALPIVDVRQRSEFTSGHVPASRHVELGDLGVAAAALPAGPVAVICGHGERAMTAASLLERGGRGEVTVLAGGVDDWAAGHGVRLDVGG